jgi:hypothetical protein
MVSVQKACESEEPKAGGESAEDQSRCGSLAYPAQDADDTSGQDQFLSLAA